MSVGAAIATVIAETAVTGVQLFLVRKNFNVKEIIFLIRNYLYAGGIMFLIVLLLGTLNIKAFMLGDFRISAKLIKIAIQISIGMISYIGGLFILRDKYTQNIVNRCLNLVKRKKIN